MWDLDTPIAFKTRNGGHVVFKVDRIDLLEARRGLVDIILENGMRYSTDTPLTILEACVPCGLFFRSHRQFLVRLDRVCAIEPRTSGTYSLFLTGGQSIPVSRDRGRELWEHFAFLK